MSKVRMRASGGRGSVKPLGLVLALGFFAPVQASAVCGVQVNGAGTIHGSIQDAYDAALSGNTLNVNTGPCNEIEPLTIAKDITIIGTGSITWTGDSGAIEVIRLASGYDLTLENLTIRRHSTTTNQRAITADGSNIIVMDDVDIDGDAENDSSGGVLYANNPTSITIRNSVLAGSGTDGGAIYATKSTSYPLLIEDTTFNGSEADDNGGAIWANNATLTCTRCTFQNTDGVAGGALYTTLGSLDIEQSLFCNTTGFAGGAIYSSSPATIRSSRFVETSSTGDGGALNIQGGTWEVENNHFLGITAGSTTGAVDQGGGTANLRNNLFYDNGTVGFHRGTGSGTVSYNWWQDNTGGHASFILDAVTNYIDDGDPELVSWSHDNNCANDSLWPTPITSPLLDIGDPAVAYEDPDGTRADIGAYGGPSAELSPYHEDNDNDGDSFLHDCDDEDELRSENQPEVCDNIDNDCNNVEDDNATDVDRFYQDCDDDEQGAVTTEVIQCFEPPPVTCPGGKWLSYNEIGNDAWTDCNDADPDTYLGAPETCDAGDQDCANNGDEGATDATTWYLDFDGDGFGDPDSPNATCDDFPPLDYVDNSDDCDDNVPTTNPNASDACGDGVDSDCNGGDGDDASILTWYPDSDYDGFGDMLGAPVYDCNAPGLDYSLDNADCDDSDGDVSPEGLEVCNDVDDDCNDVIDDAGTPERWYPDGDGDSFGNDALAVDAACQPDGYIATGGDCNDLEAAINPTALEICNEIDDDCDSKRDAEDDSADGVELVWTDWDQDGFGSCDEDAASCAPFAVCPDQISETDSYADNPDDCDDYNPGVFPGAAEIGGNNLDENCDGQYASDNPEPPDDVGCNCSAAPGTSGTVLPLLALGLLGLRRRRA